MTGNYAIAPDGTGLGVPYAYSGRSLVTLATAVAAHHGISPALVTQLHALVEGLDARSAPAGALRDYGDQYNLLEMRSSGWEHVVASPNAERAWCLDRLAELSEVSGARLPVGDLRSRARTIRNAIARELWDEHEGCFRCRYPDGHTELVRHVQAFDATRNGRRLLWIARHFPYFPQDHYCDRPAAAPSGRRVNIVAGLAGAEAILTGAAGVRRPALRGVSLPQKPMSSGACATGPRTARRAVRSSAIVSGGSSRRASKVVSVPRASAASGVSSNRSAAPSRVMERMPASVPRKPCRATM
ncbi:hypothetical protein [Nonomuraea jabiensis]|uniref:Uncharacterized protein n=1 Tax=Nonomuraea jabiensis TaxID=882448 RepID=A0A7W9LES3_9ACTN|nr:hypothetical protein [Nonomuraea jabiensis]MBB5781109.1 hypothetical protein [Nonomuraea jabiensis]